MNVENAPRARGPVAFGPFLLHPTERLLKKSGTPVRLGGRALDLLVALVEQAGEIVSHRDLYARAWPKRQVVEPSLRIQIGALRKALGRGESDAARYIATVPGRGYCFVAPISSRSDGPTEAVEGRPRAPALATNLPRYLTALIGRATELAELEPLIGAHRLVTMVGPGGVGKTRLAIASGWRSIESYPDGVWLIDLAPLSNRSLVVGAVATALGLARGATEVSTAMIVSAIRDRRLLLILDNCEHLVGPTAELAEALLQAAAGLTILATSQESLRLDTERVYRLDPLALPPDGAVEIAGYGAVDLFVRRAQAVDRRFEMDEASGGAIADICRHLDGVPLSLEMAAARVSSLGLDGLRANLGARLHVLSAGRRTADARHQTLRSTVEWSIGLLEDVDALVFRRLGIFPGDFSLEAAMAVVAAGEMDRWDVADAIARLVDKSVLTLERGGPARYRLLETLRLYARELLRDGSEWDRLAESHARHFCRVFAPSREAYETLSPLAWQSIYLPERDNLRAALDWVLADAARLDLAVELTAASGFVWYGWSLLEEGRRFTGPVLNSLDESTPPTQAAKILRDAGQLLSRSIAHRGTERLFERSAAICRQMGDELGLASANLALAQRYLFVGGRESDAAAAMSGVPEVLSGSGYKRSLCVAASVLAIVASRQQNFPEAIDRYRLSIELAKERQDERAEYLALVNLAVLEFSRGDIERAIELGRESIRGLKSIWQTDRLLIALHNLAAYLLAAGRLDEARPMAQEVLSLLSRGHEDFPVQLVNLQMWALIAALEGHYAEAARLVGWVDAAYERMGHRREAGEQLSYERLLSLLEAQLSKTELSAFAAEGARRDADWAMNFAFEHIVHAAG